MTAGWPALVLAFTSVVTLDCSSEPPLDPATFPSVFVRAGCARVQACCALWHESPLNGETQTSCEAMNDFSAALMGDLDNAVRGGRAMYDARKATACIEKLQTTGCGTRIDVTRADMVNADCAGAVRGLATMSGICDSSWDCMPGLFCDAIPDATPLCVSRRSDGAPCASDEQCASGSCTDRTCEERPPICTAS